MGTAVFCSAPSSMAYNQVGQLTAMKCRAWNCHPRHEMFLNSAEQVTQQHHRSPQIDMPIALTEIQMKANFSPKIINGSTVLRMKHEEIICKPLKEKGKEEP